MKTTIFTAMCLGLVLNVIPTQVAASPILSVLPSTQTAILATPVNVGIRIAGLGDGTAPSLGAFDLTLSFDPAILAFLSVQFGDPDIGDQLDLLGLGSLNGVTPGTGIVSLFELSLDSVDDLDTLQTGMFTLARLQFNTVGVGTSAVNLAINALSDSAGGALTATLENGSVSVTSQPAVPESGSGVLFLFGFGLILALTRKASRNARKSDACDKWAGS
ncbi:MAG: cohesin domain-containing protein [Bryobacteraceae bacterium]